MRNFEQFYKKLLEYKKEHGNCLVPTRYVTSDGYRIGNSIISIRNGDIRINEIERKALDEIGFVWHVRANRSFEENYDLILKYKEEHGNCLIHADYVTSDGVKLGRFVSSLRRRRDELPIEKKKLLDEIGFLWKAARISFEEIYNLIVKYKEKYGDCLIPQKYVTPEGISLGSYVTRIRRGNIAITDSQKEMLNELGFVWRLRNRRLTFDERIELILDYKNEYGDCLVPQKYVTKDGVLLGCIVRNIRSGKIIINEDQRKRLDEIGFVWQVRNSSKLH